MFRPSWLFLITLTPHTQTDITDSSAVSPLGSVTLSELASELKIHTWGLNVTKCEERFTSGAGRLRMV